MLAILLTFLSLFFQLTHQACQSPSFSPFTSITLNTPTLSQLQQSLHQYTLAQPDPASASGFFKQTLAYLIPLAVISTIALGFLIYIIWKNIKKESVGNEEQQTKEKTPWQYFVIFMILLMGIGLIGLGSYNIVVTRATTSQLQYLNCTSTQLLNGYHYGTDSNWMGAQYITNNLSTIRMSFINNLKQLRNGLRGLTLNASGLGVPFSVTYPTMKSYMTALMGTWLTRNSSVSATILAPVCRVTPYTVPHPSDNTMTVSFPMMATICTDLTKETNSFIQNAEYLDYLLTNYTQLITNASNINTSLSTLSTTYSSFETEMNNYDSSDISIPYLQQYKSVMVVSYIASALSILIGTSCLVAVALIFAKQSPEAVSKLSLVINILLFCMIIFSSVACIYYLLEAVVFKYISSIYQYLPSTQLYNKLISIYSFKEAMVSPIYKCMSNSSSQFVTSDFTTLKTLTNLNQLYVNSTPPQVLSSLSINYTNLTLQYLGDLSKLTLSDGTNLTTILSTINHLANYNITNSTQLPCAAAMDQFHYHPLNCTAQILDPSNTSEITIRQPRCIQIPSGERESGSTRTSFNQVQNLYNITTAPCNSMGNMFNSTSCFFQQRISTLFASSDCTLKGTSLSTMVKNLVAFSTAAGDAWDIYTQNLRNYLGAFLTYTTNISTFYTNSNVSEIFTAFSSPAANIMANSSCEYIHHSVHSLYDQLVRSVDFFLMVVVFTFSISIVGFVMMFGVWQIEKKLLADNKINNMDVEEGTDIDRTKSKRRRVGIEEGGLGNDINLTIQNIKDDEDIEQIIIETPKKQMRKRRRNPAQQGQPKQQQLTRQRTQPPVYRKRHSEPFPLNKIQQHNEESQKAQQLPIQPLQFIEEEATAEKNPRDPNNNIQTITMTPVIYKSTLTRPGEFASSSVKNIKNVILFDGDSRELEGNVMQDNVQMEDLEKFDLSERRKEERVRNERQSEEGDEWVSATLSEPNNK